MKNFFGVSVILLLSLQNFVVHIFFKDAWEGIRYSIVLVIYCPSDNEDPFRVWESKASHCVKSIQIGSFSWSVFSHIRTEYKEILRRISISLHIQSGCGKIRARKNSVFGHFLRSEIKHKASVTNYFNQLLITFSVKICFSQEILL